MSLDRIEIGETGLLTPQVEQEFDRPHTSSTATQDRTSVPDGTFSTSTFYIELPEESPTYKAVKQIVYEAREIAMKLGQVTFPGRVASYSWGADNGARNIEFIGNDSFRFVMAEAERHIQIVEVAEYDGIIKRTYTVVRGDGYAGSTITWDEGSQSAQTSYIGEQAERLAKQFAANVLVGIAAAKLVDACRGK